jgi:hypothetical protein
LKKSFYGWECISLKLQSRTYDLVIKNDRDRNAFIQAIEVAMAMHRCQSQGFEGQKIALDLKS